MALSFRPLLPLSFGSSHVLTPPLGVAQHEAWKPSNGHSHDTHAHPCICAYSLLARYDMHMYMYINYIVYIYITLHYITFMHAQHR
ncbi:hypothetical protein GGI42DRAFT_315152 [Trichoderma sp. SZMC 28013]